MNRWLTYKTRKILAKLIRVCFAVIIGFTICQLDLDYVESWFYDIRIRYTTPNKTSGNVETIEINPTVVEVLRGEPSAANYTQLVQELIKEKPKAIVFLTDMSQLEGTANDLLEFVNTAKSLDNLFFTTKHLIIKGQEDKVKLAAPLDEIPVVMNLLTKDDNKFARDSVTRRVILSNSGRPFIHHRLAQMYNDIESVHQYRGQFNYLTSIQTYIDFRPKSTYKPISFLTAMQGAFNKGKYTDKIILIGRNTNAEAGDYKLTPYSRELTAMSNLEVHANIIDTLILNSSPQKSPMWFNYIITILISILTVFSVFTLRPSKGLFVLITALSGLVGLSFALYLMFGLMIYITYPILAIFICYYFFIPYRLIMENRKSWEYFQHNKLLSEVEELKTNFLRMMSHDLKTPLARIQGMTEVALREENQLNGVQKDALVNINNSSSELTSMIESILDLNRIESQKVQLQLQSKDINGVLQNVVKKCTGHAKDKNIVIITEFEPLFSSKVDEALLSQVFTNLIENSIKYSPEGSKILVSTEEVDGKLIIQVADQGFGIKNDDLSNVFDKFYRSQSEDTTSIKGTGLGLYLSKYFVELHKGTISLESELSKGSTFTVELPMDLEN